MAEQIRMLFGVNTPRSPWNIVLDVGPDPPTERWRGPSFKFWDSPLIFGTAGARLEILHAYRWVGALMKTMQQ